MTPPENRFARAAQAAACLVALAAASCTDEPPIEDPACFETLPDLDGDGILSEGDCELTGVGAAVATLCENDPTLWIDNSACATETEQAILQGRDASVWGPMGWGFLISTNTEFGTWRDLNADSRVDDGELSTVPGFWGGPILDASGWTPATAVTAETAWFDADRDSVVTSAELIDLRPVFGAALTAPRITILADKPVVAAYVQEPQGGVVLAWHDLNGNHASDPGEALRFPSYQLVGLFPGALYYMDQATGSLMVWRSLDWVVDPGETSMIARVGRRCQRIVGHSGDSLTCIGSRTSGEWEYVHFFGPEADTVESTVLPGEVLSVTADGGSHVMLQLRRPGLPPMTWQDLDDNEVAEGREMFSLNVTSPTGEGVVSFRDGWFSAVNFVPAQIQGVISRVVDPATRLHEVFVKTRSPAGRYLGDPCTPEEPCALNLTCRISGAVAEPRCVPAAP